tara:strand:+ start:8814 stop:9962 length:1149 start_codon:yes stop_codon:yes gene_type:complete
MADTYEVMGVTYSTATGLPISGVTNESTTKVEEVTKKEVVEAVPPDETNDNTDGSTAEENQKVNLTVIANNETTQIGSDQTGTFIVDKNQGHGLHVQKNGDVIVIAGSPGKGKKCGGRMLVKSDGGQLVKTGPTVVERTASSTSAVEGDGSSTSENSGSGKLAHSETNYGDVEIETLGEEYIRAKDIVLDAVDSLTLKAGSQIVIDVGHLIINASSVEENIGAERKVVDSSSENEIKEETSKQYDTRASKNVVGSGHVNQKVQGDWKVAVAGTVDLQIQGNKKVIGLNSGTAGLTVGLNGISETGAFRLNAKDIFEIKATKDLSFESESGKFDLKGLGASTIDATGGLDIKAAGDMDIETEGKLTVKATGDFKVTAAKIYLN